MKPTPKILLFTALFPLYSPIIFADYPTKTSGCPNEWGDINAPVNPSGGYRGYGYYCIAPGPSPADGCNAIKSGPYQIKYPMSQAYQESPQFAKYLQQLQDSCDPDSGIQARYYLVPAGTKNTVIPQKCDLVNNKEVCTNICKPQGDCS